MALTKAQARTLVWNLIDDEARKVLTPAVLDVLMQLTIDELRGELLDDVKMFVSQVDTVIADSGGLIDLTSTGPLSKRFNKLQTLMKDSYMYSPTKIDSVAMQDGLQVSAPDKTFVILGDILYPFPLDSGCQYEIRYSYLPTPFTSLAETDEVEWTDGFESAFVFESAARAMVKGSKETVGMYQVLSKQSMDRLRGRLKRQHIGVATVGDLDDPIADGGV